MKINQHAYFGDRKRPAGGPAPTSKLSVVTQIVLQAIPKDTNTFLDSACAVGTKKIIGFIVNCEWCIMKPMVNINVNQGYGCSSRDYGNHVAYNASVDVSIQV